MFGIGKFWSQIKVSEPASVLSYLGIQRRAGEEGGGARPEPKAKKSFRPSSVEIDSRSVSKCDRDPILRLFFYSCNASVVVG
jgi:hypothetical protein